MTEVQRLEQSAVDAYRDGIGWNDFWAKHEAAIKSAVPRDRFQGFFKRMFCMVVAGDLSGSEPIGSDECSWERDDENSKPDDVKTSARWQGIL